MALYNKDGTVYRLEGPNPIMKSQNFWDEFLTHNMRWQPEVHSDSGSKLLVHPARKQPATQSEVFVEELESSKESYKEEETNHEAPETTPESKSSSRPGPVEADVKIEKTFVHCLPATTREKKDSLYGDVIQRVAYKSRTSFEAVVLGQSDMKIEMWSEVSFEEGSILYPKNGDKRWWKVQNVYPKLGGYVIQAAPSQDHPYFD